MDYIIGNSEVLEFRDGIFALRTRRFGTVAEIMIKKLYDFEESGSLAFDKKDIKTNERIEVKFSTVLKENDDTIRGDNVISQVIKANLANRAMNSKDAEIYDFDCNIQQVKRKEFDVLYYGLFFSDVIEIYKMVLVPGDFDHSVTGEKSQKVTRENDQKSHLTPLIIQFPEDCQKQFLPFL